MASACALQKNIPKMQPPSPQVRAKKHDVLTSSAVLVILLTALVHVSAIAALAPAVAGTKQTSKKPAKSSPKQVPLASLPAPVQEMRDAILNAAEAGDINEMRIAIEWNELRPELGINKEEDPIAQWKKKSADGEGREILAILANILREAPAQVPLGRDFENNAVFIWPYLAELPLKKLTPAQTVELYQLVPAPLAKTMTESGTWSWYRIAIGADGTWHSFSKTD